MRLDGGGTVVWRAAYDGDGARRKRLDGQGTVHYLGGYQRNVGNGQDTGEVVTKYYHALGRLIAFRRNGTLYWVGTDHLGGTIRVADADFSSVDGMRYTPYGVSRDAGANLHTDHRFTGQILDGSVGLYWYASRAYDPALGRFTCPDTIVPEPGNPQALNRYAYCGNNPLGRVDPSGHDYSDFNWSYDHGRGGFYNDAGERWVSPEERAIAEGADVADLLGEGGGLDIRKITPPDSSWVWDHYAGTWLKANRPAPRPTPTPVRPQDTPAETDSDASGSGILTGAALAGAQNAATTMISNAIQPRVVFSCDIQIIEEGFEIPVVRTRVEPPGQALAVVKTATGSWAGGGLLSVGSQFFGDLGRSDLSDEQRAGRVIVAAGAGVAVVGAVAVAAALSAPVWAAAGVAAVAGGLGEHLVKPIVFQQWGLGRY